MKIATASSRHLSHLPVVCAFFILGTFVMHSQGVARESDLKMNECLPVSLDTPSTTIQTVCLATTTGGEEVLLLRDASGAGRILKLSTGSIGGRLADPYFRHMNFSEQGKYLTNYGYIDPAGAVVRRADGRTVGKAWLQRTHNRVFNITIDLHLQMNGSKELNPRLRAGR